MNAPKQNSPAIEVQSVTKRYRKTLAVDGLSLSIAPGEVYGLLGHNGAGKTTTIKCLLGLEKPTTGSTRVLGLESWRHGVEIRRRTGYVPESPEFYGFMTVRQTLWFVSQFHPTWDAALERDLVARLELPLDKKMSELSRGTAAKVALACATAFRPEALLLDDPTSGLDAVVRREIIAQVIDLAAEGGHGVLFASHVLDEVERLADRVGIVVAGRLMLERRIDELKSAFRRVTVTFAQDAPSAAELPASLACERSGRTATLVVDGFAEADAARLRATGATNVRVDDLSLEDIFVAVVQASKRSAVPA